MDTLGDRIKIIRGKLSQSEFADKLGVNRSIIADLERGKTKKPNKYVIEKLERIFHINIDWLITGNGDIYSHPPTSPQPLPQTQISKLSPKMDELVYLFSILDKKDQKRIYKEIKTLADEKMDLSFLDEE